MDTRPTDLQAEEAARLEALVGRVLGDKFRLRACIGIGGSGAVFRADQITLGRTVAVKILSSQLASDPRLVRRFQDEALAASRLNHPNTVSVIDYGQSPDGLLYLVMEYVKGPTLTQLVGSSHPLPLDRVLEIVGQIVAGMEEAHLAGVIHADLKSDNVIVDQRRPDWDVVKVVDFGIARLITAPRDGDDRTICGTPEYMAPETITGAPPSFASDLYSVGIIFYELLTGATPFVGGTTVEILTKQLRHAPVPPSEVRPGSIPDGVQEVCLRALAKHPGDRYIDARELRQAIQALKDARRMHRSSNAATCESCSAQIPARFRFCPECGQPRTPGFLTVREPSAAAEAAPPKPPKPTIELELTGRDRALDAVVRHLRATTSPAVLHLSGPAGCGRSQLLRAAYERLASSGLTIYQSSPDPTGLATPLYPIRAACAAILALPPVCTLEELNRAAGDLGLQERDLPGLAELFGHSGSLSDLEPMVRRREMIASTVRALQLAAHDKPIGVVFENVDDYDHPSQELIRRLGERSEECPQLRLVVTSRPELPAQWRGNAAHIEIEPLDGQALTGVAGELVKSGVPNPPRAHTLAALTRGMLGHVEHLVRYLNEGDSVGDGLATLADLVAARISLLPQSALDLAQTVAVFGNECDRDLLARAAEMSPNAFENAVSVLTARQILFDAGGGVVQFATPLLRDIVYDTTPADVRRALHGHAATLIAQVANDPAVLGHHHDLAGNADQAAEHLMRAGDRASHYLDDEGACALYQRALRAARSVLYSGDEDHDTQRYTMLSVKLADALCASGQLGLARGILEETRPWAAGIPRSEAMIARAAAHLAIGDDDLHGATEHVRRAIGHAIATGDGTLIADLYLDLAAILTRAGDADGARRELEEGVDLVTLGEGMTASGGPPEMWRMLYRLAQLASSAGDHARALQIGERALVHARRVSSRLGSARVQVMLAGECDKVGQADRGVRYREAAIEELRALGDRRSTAELIISVVAPTRTQMRIVPPRLQEARTLAAEVGWSDGAVVE